MIVKIHYQIDYNTTTIKYTSINFLNNIKIDSMENEPSTLEKTVIDNIRRIRQEKGISQLRLSIFCGTSASYIGLMETYKNIPKLSTIERIAEALNVPVLELFTENTSKTTNYDNSDDSEKRINTIEKEKERKQKIREHIKNEILSKLENNLDDILQMI